MIHGLQTEQNNRFIFIIVCYIALHCFVSIHPPICPSVRSSIHSFSVLFFTFSFVNFTQFFYYLVSLHIFFIESFICVFQLDDKAVQHREVMGHESTLFKSYFKVLQTMEGGYVFKHSTAQHITFKSIETIVYIFAQYI